MYFYKNWSLFYHILFQSYYLYVRLYLTVTLICIKWKSKIFILYNFLLLMTLLKAIGLFFSPSMKFVFIDKSEMAKNGSFFLP